jgi:hypothetical protein
MIDIKNNLVLLLNTAWVYITKYFYIKIIKNMYISLLYMLKNLNNNLKLINQKQKFKWPARTTKINKNKKISMNKKYQKQASQKIGYHLPIYKSQQI